MADFSDFHDTSPIKKRDVPMPMRDDMSHMRVELFEIKRTGFVNSPDSRMNCSTSGEHERLTVLIITQLNQTAFT